MKKTVAVILLVMTCAMESFAQADILVWQGRIANRMLKVDSVSFFAPPSDKHDYVDLGLPSGLKWATCNIGTNESFGYGDYFAWGEVVPKDEFGWNTYKFMAEGKSSRSFVTKYTVDDDEKKKNGIWYENGIFVGDSLTKLHPEDDVATAIWGSGWRMPTKNEWMELYDNCDWEWTRSYNGTCVAGYIGTSKTNGNTIFLPAAGYNGLFYSKYEFNERGNYWTSELCDSGSAWYLRIFDGMYISSEDRSQGFSVRAVVAE